MKGGFGIKGGLCVGGLGSGFGQGSSPFCENLPDLARPPFWEKLLGSMHPIQSRGLRWADLESKVGCALDGWGRGARAMPVLELSRVVMLHCGHVKGWMFAYTGWLRKCHQQSQTEADISNNSEASMLGRIPRPRNPNHKLSAETNNPTTHSRLNVFRCSKSREIRTKYLNQNFSHGNPNHRSESEPRERIPNEMFDSKDTEIVLTFV